MRGGFNVSKAGYVTWDSKQDEWSEAMAHLITVGTDGGTDR